MFLGCLGGSFVLTYLHMGSEERRERQKRVRPPGCSKRESRRVQEVGGKMATKVWEERSPKKSGGWEIDADRGGRSRETATERGKRGKEEGVVGFLGEGALGRPQLTTPLTHHTHQQHTRHWPHYGVLYSCIYCVCLDKSHASTRVNECKRKEKVGGLLPLLPFCCRLQDCVHSFTKVRWCGEGPVQTNNPRSANQMQLSCCIDCGRS